MTPAQLLFLKTEEARALLSTLEVDEHNHLNIVSRLRQQFEPAEVHALVETALLRKSGAKKFSRSSEMFFTRPGLEQASGEHISRYRAERYRQIGPDFIIDLGCGIGGDAAQLSGVAPVIGVDIEPIRVYMAAENVAAYGNGARFQGVVADAYQFRIGAATGRRGALFLDPARRDAQGRRRFRLSQYEPGLEIVQNWGEMVGVGVKIGPGVDYSELPPPEEAAVEFISVNGEVKEGVLWYGALRALMPAGRRATLLPGGHFIEKAAHDIEVEIGEPRAYLYEPDGAVIRAHLVKELALRLDAQLIDSKIAYLTADQLHLSPFAAAYEVLDTFPFQLKRLKRYVAEQRFGPLTVKKRGSPLDPDWVLSQLKQKNRAKKDRAATIFLTQIQGTPSVIITGPKLQN